MINIPLNAEVECADGPCGESTHIVINPTTQQVTYFVVREKKGGDTERLVAVDQVVDTTSNLIRLGCTEAELAELEPFIETHYIRSESPDDQTAPVLLLPYTVPQDPTLIEMEEQRIPPGQLAVRRGTGVEATDGWVGQVDEFLVDPATGHITHLVLREGHLWGKKDLPLPIAAIDRVFDDTVYLKLDKQTIESLPAIPVRRSFGWAEAEIELLVLTFNETGKADEVLQFLKQLDRGGIIGAVRNAAVLVKDKDGETSLEESQDVDAKQGRLFGAITGGLIGLIGGPVGAVVGAVAGAAAGGMAAERIDMGFSNKYLKSLQNYLQPGSSALIALVEHEWTGKVVESLDHFGGQLFRQALTDEIVAELTAEPDDGS